MCESQVVRLTCTQSDRCMTKGLGLLGRCSSWWGKKLAAFWLLPWHPAFLPTLLHNCSQSSQILEIASYVRAGTPAPLLPRSVAPFRAPDRPLQATPRADSSLSKSWPTQQRMRRSRRCRSRLSCVTPPCKPRPATPPRNERSRLD